MIGADGVLCDLTKTLAGDAAEVSCLVKAGQDPHGMKLKPSQRAELAKAKLVLINGYNLTPSLKTAKTNIPVISVGELAVPSNPDNDPHIWHDPTQVVAMSRVVSNKLKTAADNSAAAGIAERQSQAATILRDLERWSQTQIATVPEKNRVLVSKHKAFGFLANRYGIRELPVMDAYAPGGALRPSSLGQISSAIKASGTKAIFAESLPPSKTLRRISRSSGIPIASGQLYPDGLAPGKNLVQTATTNVCTFVTAQGGQCNQEQAQRLSARWAALS